MRLNILALSLTFGLLWGAAILFVAVANLIWPGYGRAFLDLIASLYPGINVGSGTGAIAGMLYGFVDGAIGGALFGWLYNLLVRRFPGVA
jgi:hypothetical protein